MNSLTILTITSKKDGNKGYSLLKEEQSKILFLNPKISLIDDCENYRDYNYRCVSKLYEYFDTDFVLIVQFDGRIINQMAWTDDFFEYDYIGAPWSTFFNHLKMKDDETNKIINEIFSKNPNRYLVGNGGFSLRSRKFVDLCSKLSEKYLDKSNKIINEDVFVCTKNRLFLESNGILFPSIEIASRFSTEEKDYNGSFGAHRYVFKNGRKIWVKDIKK